MRLNLGAGDMYVRGWHNVDHDGCPYQRDETVDLTGPLPWAAGSFTHAYAGHVLEHLTEQQCLTLLTALAACMMPGGQLMIVGPDVNLARAMGTGPYHTLDELIHGGQRWPGDEHRWECSTPAVMALLFKAGWQDITDVGISNVPLGWPVADRGPQWQLAVSAIA